MARITSYKVTATLTRNSATEITVQLQEDTKTPVGTPEELGATGMQSITSKAKQVSDHNEVQMGMANRGLLPDEETREVTLTLKYLED